MYRSTRLGFFFVLALTLATGYYYLRPGFFDVHDPTHIGRVILLWESLKSGQIPALWASSANRGFGYPLFHFYAPSFYYLVLLIKLVTPTYLTALKIGVLLFSLIGTLGIYKLVSGKGRAVAVLASTAFALVPYRSLALYVRGSYAEFASTMLLPWVLIAWNGLDTRRKQLAAGLVMALFLLSHNLIPLIAFPFIALWILWKNIHQLKNLILPSLLVIGLSTFYLLPVIFERGFVHLKTQALATNYTEHFVAPTQLWNSTWGFGGSAPGPEDGISFKLGKLQILLALLGLVALLKRKSSHALAIFFTGLTCLSIFFMTSASSWFWAHLTVLDYVQFPWRFMALATFGLAFLSGYSALLFKNKKLKLTYLLITVCLLLFFNLKYFAPQKLIAYTDSDFTSREYLSGSLAAKVPEYLPVYMPAFPDRDATAVPSEIDLSEAGEYKLDLAYYPTWKITLDGRAVEYHPTEDGLIGINLSAGSHTLSYAQSHTPLENFASLISLLTIIIVGYFYAKTR